MVDQRSEFKMSRNLNDSLAWNRFLRDYLVTFSTIRTMEIPLRKRIIHNHAYCKKIGPIQAADETSMVAILLKHAKC
jgi:hypothetical protein